MSTNYREHDTNLTKARPCYSSMSIYGSNGKVRPIQAPTPVTIQPYLFNLMRPHKMPDGVKQNSAQHMSCGPYKTLDGTCNK